MYKRQTYSTGHPQFKNLEQWDLTLHKDSPLYQNGWKEIAYDKIGNSNDPAFLRLQKQGLPKALGNFYYDSPKSYFDYDIE